MPGAMKTEWDEQYVEKLARTGREVYLTIAQADDIKVNSVAFRDGMVIFSTEMEETHILPVDRPMSVVVRDREDAPEQVVQRMSEALESKGDTGQVPLASLGIRV